MKPLRPSSVLLCFLAFLAAGSVRAQFPNFPAADRVLGSIDFDTVGDLGATPPGLDTPTGLAIDPRTGKLFVASTGQNRVLRFSSVSTLTNTADAEVVFGQVNFSGTGAGASATGFNLPYGIHVDGKSRLWVADINNNRVLMFQGSSTLTNGATPDRVFGQPDFTTTTSGTSNVKMNRPIAVCVDADDNLWVAETANNRVVMFADVSTLSSGAAATLVLGQPNFSTATAATSAVKMRFPNGVFVDGAGRLWVSEQTNARVLRFDDAATLADGAPADGVLGHLDFITISSGSISAQTFSAPSGVVVDAAGTLYVADDSYERVLIFKNAAAKADGAAADGVIGQPDFVTPGVGPTQRVLTGCYLGIALDPAGALWVTDRDSNRVLRFSPDRTAAPPRVTSRVPKSTRAGSITLRGTASDTSGIAAVRYRIGSGAYRNAVGTTSWRVSAKLKAGGNTIQIIATDIVGNTSVPKKVRVVRN